MLVLTVEGADAGLLQAAIDALEVMEAFQAPPRQYSVAGPGFAVTAEVLPARPEPAALVTAGGAALYFHPESGDVAWLIAPLPGYVPCYASTPP